MNLVWKAGQAADSEPGSEAEKGPPSVEAEIDVETGVAMPEHRPTHVLNAVQVAFTLMLIITLLGLGYKQLAFQILVDKGWLRLAFLAMTPVLVFFSLVSTCSSQWNGHPLMQVVFLPSDRHQFVANIRSHSSNAIEFEVLLRRTPASHQRHTSSHYYTMSRVQRGANVGYCTYCEVSQAGNVYL